MRHYKIGQTFHSPLVRWTITDVQQKTLDGYNFMSHTILKEHKVHRTTHTKSISFKKLSKFLKKMDMTLETTEPSFLDEDLFII